MIGPQANPWRIAASNWAGLCVPSMCREHAVVPEGFDHSLRDQPNAHSGYEESDDAGCCVDAQGADPHKIQKLLSKRNGNYQVCLAN
jgi:hypothetical protein